MWGRHAGQRQREEAGNGQSDACPVDSRGPFAPNQPDADHRRLDRAEEQKGADGGTDQRVRQGERDRITRQRRAAEPGPAASSRRPPHSDEKRQGQGPRREPDECKGGPVQPVSGKGAARQQRVRGEADEGGRGEDDDWHGDGTFFHRR